MLKATFFAGAGAICHVIRQRAFAAAKVPVVRALATSAGSAAAPPDGPKTSFRLGMCQVGPVGTEKPKNLVLARNAVEQAVREGAELVVLPECFNSPYATDQFPVYAEPIPPVGTTADAAAALASASPSTISAAAPSTSPSSRSGTTSSKCSPPAVTPSWAGTTSTTA